MPAGQPFTRLCQQLAHLRAESIRADLHLHSGHSDGAWTPAEIVERAVRRGLGAIAVTDHDTCSGVAEAQAAAQSTYPSLEVITGVEITCEYAGRELHLLGYFHQIDDADLNCALARLRENRRHRFQEMVARLAEMGIILQQEWIQQLAVDGHALGRRDLAVLLVRAERARSVSEALTRYLRDGGPVIVCKKALPLAEAIELLHAAGGICSWAHPPKEIDLRSLQLLRDMGLDALEVEYPTHKRSVTQRLRDLAKAAGLAVSGGSDCHGPTPTTRAIGSRGIVRAELEELRRLATPGGARTGTRFQTQS